MSDSMRERIDAASSFLLQSPPGEINDVVTDLRAIVSVPDDRDARLEHHLLPALKKYNCEQYIVATLDRGAESGRASSKVVVTPVSRLGDSTASSVPATDGREHLERHVDYRREVTFSFDHLNSTASDPQPIPRVAQFDDGTIKIVRDVDPLFEKHVANHYVDGVSAVYPLEDARYPPPESAEPEPIQEEAHEETGGLAQGLPASAEESAETARETAEAVNEAIPEDSDASVPETDAGMAPGAEEQVETTTPMDLGTPQRTTQELDDAPESSDHRELAEETNTNEKTPTGEESRENQSPREQERPLRTSRLFGLYLVGNKYNPNNYWTGRWRANYVLDFDTGKVDGNAMINIHYYEQGNVQLSTELHSTTELGPNPSAQQVVAAIKASEQQFATSLATTYSQLSDETFRGLRRALPKTRSKIDWHKAGGYRLGAELGGGGQQ